MPGCVGSGVDFIIIINILVINIILVGYVLNIISFNKIKGLVYIFIKNSMQTVYYF